MGFSKKDMRSIFKVGDRVKAKRVNGNLEVGTVCAVTEFLVIVQFKHSRESYILHDYEIGQIKFD